MSEFVTVTPSVAYKDLGDIVEIKYCGKSSVKVYWDSIYHMIEESSEISTHELAKLLALPASYKRPYTHSNVCALSQFCKAIRAGKVQR